MKQIKNMFDSVPQLENGNRVHHLNLNKDEIAKGVILTSNLERTKTIADTFDKAELLGRHREYISYRGEKHGVDMSIMSCGNGCMPMAIAVEELRHIDCRNMIKVGTCNAIAEDVEPGTIIVPVAAVRGEGATLEYVNLQYPAVTDVDVFFCIMDAAKELGIPVRTGVVRTHDAMFLESSFAHEGMEERIKPWRDLGVVAIDNEAAAMLAIASILGSKAGAVYVAVDNHTTGESMDFKQAYPERMKDAIVISTLALSKMIKALEK